MKKIKQVKIFIFDLIRDDDINDLKAKIFDSIILLLIIQSVISVILSTFSDLPHIIITINNNLESISITIFSIEYLARVWVSDLYHPEQSKLKTRIKYIFSFMAIIDLLAILPFYIPFLINTDLRALRVLRLSRLMRIFKLGRYFTALNIVVNVLKRKKEQLLSSIFVVGVLMVFASILMYYFEHDAQPTVFQNAFSGLWWAIATLTTVGYGDIYPITMLGKILSSFIAILGIGLVAVPTGIISAGFSEELEVEKSDEKIKYCPSCGKKLK